MVSWHRPSAAQKGGLSLGRKLARCAADERGQIIPLLMVAMTALLATGILLFQTGRAADLRAQGQTAADAAALGGGQELMRQLTSLDGSLNVDEGAVRDAAAEYASRNDGELTSFERDGYEVRVQVRTKKSLGGDEGGAAPDDDDDERGTARAQARVEVLTGFNGFGFFGGLGATTEGLAPALEDAAALATKMGLTITSTTGGVHAAGSFHYKGLAIDVGGSASRMREYFLAVLERYGTGQFLELFYDAMPYYVDNGRRIGGQFGGHGDHVHLALPGNAKPIGGEDEDEDDSGKGGDAKGKDGGREGGGNEGDGGEGDDGDTDTGSGLCDGQPDSEGTLDDDEKKKDEDDRGAGRRPQSRRARAGPPSLEEVRDSKSIPAIVYAVGRSLGATSKQMLAAFETAIVESRFQNLPYGDRDSLGVFQQRPSAGWGTPQQILDPFYAARKFFLAAKKVPQGGTTGQLAQSVQISAFPERYDQVEAQAEQLIEQVESGKRPIIKGGLGAIAPCGLPVSGGATVKLVEYEG